MGTPRSTRGRSVVAGFVPPAARPWTPKHPGQAVNPGDGVRPDLPIESTGAVPLPQSTHVEKVLFQRGGVPSTVRPGQTTEARIVVWFRSAGRPGGYRVYTYHGDQRTMRDIYDRLVTSPHPWRLVGYPELAREGCGIRYRPGADADAE